jgi:hypothetical protein
MQVNCEWGFCEEIKGDFQMYRVLFILVFLLQSSGVLRAHDFALAFVHIGKNIPRHLEYSLKQARFFNTSCPIYLLLSEEALPSYNQLFDDRLKEYAITQVNLSKLPLSKTHRAYKKCSAHKFNMSDKEGFWSHTTERFFYLYAFMKAYKITNLFHQENDVMLYEDLSTLMPALNSMQSQIAIPFQYKTNCVASLVFFKKAKALKNLNKHIFKKISTYRGHHPEADINDMRTLASYRKATPLPILMPEYDTLYKIRKVSIDHAHTKLHFLYQHEELFQDRLFDAASLGIYLDGYDPILNSLGPGAIHYRALFNPSKFAFFWAYNEKGKKVPRLRCHNKTYSIINLHIHSKRLERYTSYHTLFPNPLEALDPKERGFTPTERKA